jgi:hypothetical protein
MQRLSAYAVGGISVAALSSFLMPAYTSSIQVMPDDPGLKSEYVYYESPKGDGKIKALLSMPVDAKQKQVRVDCEVIGCTAPLEFFCVVSGTSEHESILRTKAKPSNIHLALLMLGLQPGEPVKYSETAKIGAMNPTASSTVKTPIAGMERDTYVQEWTQTDIEAVLRTSGFKMILSRPFERKGGRYPLLSILART